MTDMKCPICGCRNMMVTTAGHEYVNQNIVRCVCRWEGLGVEAEVEAACDRVPEDIARLMRGLLKEWLDWFLNGEDYHAALEALQEHRRSAILNGEWPRETS